MDETKWAPPSPKPLAGTCVCVDADYQLVNLRPTATMLVFGRYDSPVFELLEIAHTRNIVHERTPNRSVVNTISYASEMSMLSVEQRSLTFRVEAHKKWNAFVAFAILTCRTNLPTTKFFMDPLQKSEFRNIESG